jgi:hypothetical protein
VHHTSFLWDYQQRNMALLTNPAKQPAYRGVRGAAGRLAAACASHHSTLTQRPPALPAQGRDHSEFLVRLRDVLPGRQQLLDGLVGAADAQFTLQVGRAPGRAQDTQSCACRPSRPASA